MYLPLRCILTECTENGKFTNFEYYQTLLLLNSVHVYFPCNVSAKLSIHGPALLRDNSYRMLLSIDHVHCVRCLSWPPQAADWPTRHRNYDWPDSATVDRVVGNGCDLVGVAHRQCRQDEWKNRLCISIECHSHEQNLYC